METIYLDGSSLTIEQVVRIARRRDIRVALAPEARATIEASRAVVERAVREGRVVYGITTGFGFLKNVTIDPKQTAALQENLVRSHSVGVGRPFAEEVVRAAMVIRANSLARGYSGIRTETLEALLTFVNLGIYPYVPEQGSVGASGDLAPLAHLTLALMGEGECWRNGTRVPSREELARFGIVPIKLESKEGLALTNGTSFMTAVASLALADAERLEKIADIAAALSVEALMGSLVPFHSRVHELRAHPGQIASAANIRRLCAESNMIASHADCDRVQDAYSLRCTPQVHGACRDAITYVRQVVERELNSVTDNPLVFPEEDIVRSAGNFHGEPIAIATDVLAIAVAELADISERRIAKMMDPSTSEGLPVFLISKEHAGLSSGYMMLQYTAAALVSENNVLAHPASVDSIPTSANQEDHVSMGTIAARKAREIVKNATNVLAVELLCGAQAADLRAPLTLGVGTRIAHGEVRRVVPRLHADRVLYPEMQVVRELIQSHQFLETIHERLGPLE